MCAETRRCRQLRDCVITLATANPTRKAHWCTWFPHPGASTSWFGPFPDISRTHQSEWNNDDTDLTSPTLQSPPRSLPSLDENNVISRIFFESLRTVAGVEVMVSVLYVWTRNISFTMHHGGSRKGARIRMCRMCGSRMQGGDVAEQGRTWYSKPRSKRGK